MATIINPVSAYTAAYTSDPRMAVLQRQLEAAQRTQQNLERAQQVTDAVDGTDTVNAPATDTGLQQQAVAQRIAFLQTQIAQVAANEAQSAAQAQAQAQGLDQNDFINQINNSVQANEDLQANLAAQAASALQNNAALQNNVTAQTVAQQNATLLLNSVQVANINALNNAVTGNSLFQNNSLFGNNSLIQNNALFTNNAVDQFNLFSTLSAAATGQSQIQALLQSQQLNPFLSTGTASQGILLNTFA